MIRMASSSLWVVLCVLLVAVSSASDEKWHHVCPSECNCSSANFVVTAHCTSFDFLRKVSPKIMNTLTSLDVSNGSINIVDKKLRKLVNLRRLNLSHNRLTEIKHFPHLPKLTHLNLRSNTIKTFSAKQLSEKLEFLDVSHNFIRELPQDIRRVNSLKRIYVGGNPFSCNQDSLETRDILLEHKVEIIGNPVCNDPPKFRHQSWLHAVDFDEYFKLHGQDDMLADNPEGSGSGALDHDDVFKFTELTTSMSVDVEVPEEHVAEDKDLFFDDGEGSGVEEIPTTTDIPVELPEHVTVADSIEEISGSGSGELTDKIIVFPGRGEEEEEVEEQEEDTTSPEPVDEVVVVKKVINDTLEAKSKGIKLDAIQPIQNGTSDKLDVVEESKAESSNLGMNISLLVLLICLVVVVVYFVKKYNDRKREIARQKELDLEKQNVGMELLPKQPKPSDKQNGNPETTPLMNGQNGTSGEQEKEVEANVINDLNHSPVEMRKKDPANESSSADGSPYLNVPTYSNPPSPDVMSVKVKASEIPDSIPRTPILVDRRKTSDGQNIVVTPNLNERSSTGD